MMKITKRGKSYQMYYADNTIIQQSDSSGSGEGSGSTAIVPQPNDLVKQCLALANPQEFAAFFNSFTQDDINNVQEIVRSGTLRLVGFSNTSLDPSVWIQCVGQKLSLSTYQNMFNALKSRLFLNFVANTGVGFFGGLLDNQANSEMSGVEFSRFFNSSKSVSHHVLTVGNQPIQILQVGYFVLIPSASNFTIGDKIKIAINNGAYMLHDSEFVGYHGNYGLCVCKNWQNFADLVNNNVSVTNVSVFGYEHYTYNPNIVWGTFTADVGKSYINPSNCRLGIGVQIDTTAINGNVSFTTLIRNGFVLNNDNTFTCPDLPTSMLATSNADVCFDNQRNLIREHLAFEKTLNMQASYKAYRYRKNLYKNGYSYSDMGGLSFYDTYPDLYIDLITDTYNFRFGISTEIFLIPWYAMLASGVALLAIGPILIGTGNGMISAGTALNAIIPGSGAALIAAGTALVINGQNCIWAGIALSAAATAVITPTLLVSEEIRADMNYLMVLNHANNNQIPIDVRQKTLQLLKLYVHV